MGKAVGRRKKKKKGHPSLSDLQKPSLKYQQQLNQLPCQQQKQNPNSNSNFKTGPITSNSPRRSTRRNPNLHGISPPPDNTDTDGEDNDYLNGKPREKKLKLVLKLPSQRSSLNSKSLNSNSNSDSDSDSNAEDDVVAMNHKRRKINAIGDGSGRNDTEKAEMHVSATNPTNPIQGSQLDMGPSTPLPDKKFLLFILDRLQKKDTYGVFSEPVDPNELPDYREVIEHPMDFGTMRKNLASGVYANLEQLEKDVSLICSNAMRYNAPDTIYFRQARSIQELAKKNFESLRQDGDGYEPEHKIVRRGRPLTKNLKKQLTGPSLEQAGSDFSLDATIATGAENTTQSNSDQRKGVLPSKLGTANLRGRSFHGSHNSEVYSDWSVEHKFERNNEFAGSMSKGNWIKHGKKQAACEGNRRNTYKLSHLPAGQREPSVLTTFDGERKQLLAVGLHSEYGYARSLACFAPNLGSLALKVASKKIEKCLPPGVNFGSGSVGEKDAAPPRLLLPHSPTPVQLSSSRPLSLPGISSLAVAAATPSSVDLKGGKPSESCERENFSEKQMTSIQSAIYRNPSKPLLPSQPTSSSPILANRSPELSAESAEAVRGLNSHSGFNVLSSSAGTIRPCLSTQMNSVFHNGMNGFNLATQVEKVMGSVRQIGIDLQSSQVADTVSRRNSSFVSSVTASSLNSEGSKLLENTSTINSSKSLPNLGCERFASTKKGHNLKASWQEVPFLQKKPDLVPPDLNERFQSPASPNSSQVVDSLQPDLALQP